MKIGDVYEVWNVSMSDNQIRTDIKIGGCGNLFPNLLRTPKHKIKNVQKIGTLKIKSIK